MRANLVPGGLKQDRFLRLWVARSRISMEGGQESFVLSDQALESLRQAAASVSELSAAVASINQSIERCGPPALFSLLLFSAPFLYSLPPQGSVHD